MKQLGRIDVHGLSVRGKRHAKNHDHFAIAALSKSMHMRQTNLSLDDDSRVHGENQGHLLLVADGVSGGEEPARASRTAVASIMKYFLNDMPWHHLEDGHATDVELALEDAFLNSEQEMLARAPESGAHFGTTLTLAFVSWPDLYVAHAGDSRCYLVRDGEPRLLTKDHTLSRFRRDIGAKPRDGDANVLWNALGTGGLRLEADITHLKLRVGDVLVLLTDGVLESHSADDLCAVASSENDSESICGHLVRGPRKDDSTVVVARFLPQETVEAPLGGAHQPGPGGDHPCAVRRAAASKPKPALLDEHGMARRPPSRSRKAPMHLPRRSRELPLSGCRG